MRTNNVSKCVALCGLAPAMLIAATATAQGVPTPDPIPVVFEPTEFNDDCVGPFTDQSFPVTGDWLIVNGKLEKREIQGLTPDTWLCVFDKFGEILASDDNGSGSGNGKGSGICGSAAELLTDNGDGTSSLRLAVTGFPDGFDGNCDGFFMNAPHGQQGEFCVFITYFDAGGAFIRQDSYTDEFVSGAEAFRLNFTAPAGTASLCIDIDNTCGRVDRCYDVDYMCFTNLEPLKSYCITQIGGLDEYCNPTDTVLCWIDKNCDVIFSDDNSGPALGYSQLCVIADVNGNICIAVTGAFDDNCDGLVSKGPVPTGPLDAKFDYDKDLLVGLDDNSPFVFNPDQLDSDGDGVGDVSDSDNPDNLDDGFIYNPHGVCGTYTLEVHRNFEPNAFPGDCTAESEMASKGDVNLDGIVDASDLARILSNWGMITTP